MSHHLPSIPQQPTQFLPNPSAYSPLNVQPRVSSSRTSFDIHNPLAASNQLPHPQMHSHFSPQVDDPSRMYMLRQNPQSVLPTHSAHAASTQHGTHSLSEVTGVFGHGGGAIGQHDWGVASRYVLVTSPSLLIVSGVILVAIAVGQLYVVGSRGSQSPPLPLAPRFDAMCAAAPSLPRYRMSRDVLLPRYRLSRRHRFLVFRSVVFPAADLHVLSPIAFPPPAVRTLRPPRRSAIPHRRPSPPAQARRYHYPHQVLAMRASRYALLVCANCVKCRV